MVLFQTLKGSIWSLYCHLYLCVVCHAFLFWAVIVNIVLRPLCCRFIDFMECNYLFAMNIFNDLSDKWKSRVSLTSRKIWYNQTEIGIEWFNCIKMESNLILMVHNIITNYSIIIVKFFNNYYFNPSWGSYYLAMVLQIKYNLFIHWSQDVDIMLLNCSVYTQQNVPHIL